MIDNFIKYIDDHTKEYVIFDIGSRDCMQSIEFYNIFPNAKIYSFECNPNTIEICKKNIENYKDRITLVEGAVCDYDGTVTFYPINQQKTITTWRDGNPGASSLFKSNGSYTVEHYVQDEITTNCHRLDTVMKRYNIPKVDIIWMDLQGAELLALKSLGDYMYDVKYIHTEVSYKEMYTGQVLYEELNKYILDKHFNLANNLSFSGWQDDAIYINNNINNKKFDFDIVIPVGPSDLDVIYRQIEYTKKNICGYRNIYLVCYDDTIVVDGCITISENIFPFNKNTVEHFYGKRDRNGWYLQQLIKLYSGLVIPDILDRYLVIDSDTFFLKRTTFVNSKGKCLYNYGSEYHYPYFIHMSKLNSNFSKVFPGKSGICHHMIFETKYVQEIINTIEKEHNDKFYNVFLKNVTDITGSGASEYELYFNYIFTYHKENVEVRTLSWGNVNNLDMLSSNHSNLDYISYHHYMRT